MHGGGLTNSGTGAGSSTCAWGCATAKCWLEPKLESLPRQRLCVARWLGWERRPWLLRPLWRWATVQARRAYSGASICLRVDDSSK